MGSTRHEIAERLRRLFEKDYGGDVRLVARELGLDEVELRMSLDDLAPYPTLNVLSAAVEHYGIDPTYLVTGEYDHDTHWLALEGGRRMAEEVLSRLAVSRMRHTPPATERIREARILRLA